MAFILLFILLVNQFLLGFWILSKTRHTLRDKQVLALSILAGMLLQSLIVILIDLLPLKINLLSIMVFFWGATALAYGLGYKKNIASLRAFFKNLKYRPRIYEVLALVFVIYLLIPSAWNTYYLPVQADDAIVGIDLMPKYAAEEGKINSSAYASFDYGTNQIFYAPFSGLMQIITRLIGFPFGQVWLPVIFCCLLYYVYDVIKVYAHAAIACLLIPILIVIPEYYAYSFIFQTDFINSVYFVVGAILFVHYLQGKQPSYAWLAGLFWAGAAWSRAETLLQYGGIVMAFLLIEWVRHKRLPWKESLILLIPGALLFILWNVVYCQWILSVHPYAAQVLIEFTNPIKLFSIMGQMNDYILNANYWGYGVTTFLVLLVACLVYALFTKNVLQALAKGFEYLLIILLLYLSFAVLIYHFEAANVSATFRRGFFKFLPLFFVYISSTTCFWRLSEWLRGSPDRIACHHLL